MARRFVYFQGAAVVPGGLWALVFQVSTGYWLVAPDGTMNNILPVQPGTTLTSVGRVEVRSSSAWQLTYSRFASDGKIFVEILDSHAGVLRSASPLLGAGSSSLVSNGTIAFSQSFRNGNVGNFNNNVRLGWPLIYRATPGKSSSAYSLSLSEDRTQIYAEVEPRFFENIRTGEEVEPGIFGFTAISFTGRNLSVSNIGVWSTAGYVSHSFDANGIATINLSQPIVDEGANTIGATPDGARLNLARWEVLYDQNVGQTIADPTLLWNPTLDQQFWDATTERTFGPGALPAIPGSYYAGPLAHPTPAGGLTLPRSNQSVIVSVDRQHSISVNSLLGLQYCDNGGNVTSLTADFSLSNAATGWGHWVRYEHPNLWYISLDAVKLPGANPATLKRATVDPATGQVTTVESKATTYVLPAAGDGWIVCDFYYTL
jgi:hypothetical protein